MALKLLATAQRDTTLFEAPNSISEDGNRGFAAYEINASPGNTLVAELFDLSGDTFTTVATYNNDLVYSVVAAGFANKDLTVFSVIETLPVGDLTPDNIRVRLLQNSGTGTLEPFAEVYLSGILSGFTPYGGTFVINDSAIIVTASTSTQNDNQSSTLWLLSANDLSILNNYDFEGIFTTVARAMDVGCLNFFTIGTAHGILNYNDLVNNWTPEFTLQVYKIKSDYKIKPHSGVRLPQGTYKINVTKKSKCEFNIFVGTTTALLTNAITVPVANSYNQASPDTDGKELRVYEFSEGNKLCSVYKKNTESTVDNLISSPCSGVLFISQLTGPQFLFGPAMFQYTGQHAGIRD